MDHLNRDWFPKFANDIWPFYELAVLTCWAYQIKVNLEFNFWFSCFSFCGSGPKHLFGFQTWDSFHISISVSTYLSIVSLCTRLNSQNLRFELFFSALWVSNLELWGSNPIFLGFQTQVFNYQFLTQPDNSFSRFSNFRPEKGYFNRFVKI